MVSPPQDGPICSSRHPVVGEFVKSLEATRKVLHRKSGWMLQSGEVAKVTCVDKDGDFRLLNVSGVESGWTFRKDYTFAKAPPPHVLAKFNEVEAEKRSPIKAVYASSPSSRARSVDSRSPTARQAPASRTETPVRAWTQSSPKAVGSSSRATSRNSSLSEAAMPKFGDEIQAATALIDQTDRLAQNLESKLSQAESQISGTQDGDYMTDSMEAMVAWKSANAASISVALRDALSLANATKGEGNQLFNSGKFQEAYAEYKRGIEIIEVFSVHSLKEEGSKLYVTLLTNATQALLKSGISGAESEGAQQLATKALSLDPTNIKALFRRGCAHANAGDFNLARGDFHQVLRLDPGNHEAKQELLQLRVKEGKTQIGDRSRVRPSSSVQDRVRSPVPLVVKAEHVKADPGTPKRRPTPSLVTKKAIEESPKNRTVTTNAMTRSRALSHPPEGDAEMLQESPKNRIVTTTAMTRSRALSQPPAGPVEPYGDEVPSPPRLRAKTSELIGHQAFSPDKGAAYERVLSPKRVSSVKVPPASPSKAKPRSDKHLDAVFFDFDCTLSSPAFFERANDYGVADRLELCCSLSHAECVANFGGQQRLSQIEEMLRRLAEGGVIMFIISLGFTQAINHHLERLDMERFFPQSRVFCRDTARLIDVGHKKADLIEKLIVENEWERSKALFVDDDVGHLTYCKELRACNCLHVRGRGMSKADIDMVLAELDR